MVSTRLWVVSAALALATSVAGASPCAPSATTLCLSDGRFEVKVAWKDFQGKTGDGQAIPLTPDTGYFWFFASNNIELIVKVLDARGINGKFWVFFGALSNVEYTLTVHDSVSGATKTYKNPSGTFASVGDTGAFDGSASIASAARGAVVTNGSQAPPSSIEEIRRFIDHASAPAADSTPCAGSSDRLLLANCRFAVDVQWTKSTTDVGSGQPVALTSDTGYFWFFSPSNVELMVKVLDARAISGQFWVFFGALSNVEYTVTVTDTVSGAIHTYHNPANTFASVGDTGAFRGGYSISVQTDDALTVAGTITNAEGGSLSASAADGTIFTLTVPPNAVASDQDITMTPVAATGAFPFAGGLADGVQLQPSGLILIGGATLSIHTPQPIPRAEETPVAWNGSGEDFFLFPPAPVGGDLELFISHFAGYGVARGTDAERAAQLSQEPLTNDDLLDHQLAPLLREGRGVAAVSASASLGQGAALPATTDFRSEMKSLIDAHYERIKQILITTDGEPIVVTYAINESVHWKEHVVQYLGPVDEVYGLGRNGEIFILQTTAVQKALAWIHDQCRTDFRVVAELAHIIELSRQLGLPVQPDIEAAKGCLRFKLHFDSNIQTGLKTVRRGNYSGTFVYTNAVAADLDLVPDTSASSVRIMGDGMITYTAVSVTGLPAGCTSTTSSGSATFHALLTFRNLSRFLTVEPLLRYDPGFPQSDISSRCPGDTEPYDVLNLWWINYSIRHDFDLSNQYLYSQSGWSVTRRQDPWAKATINQPFDGDDGLEKTTFVLTHTPQ